jgi:argininosuccinate lyase
MKLWSKENTSTSKQIEAFTVGRDNEFDMLLASHDVTGTIAHVTMLQEAGLMDKTEAESALKGLAEIQKEIEAGAFRIEEGIEDIHSQVELLLTRRIGEAGKKIHSGRSRNDQVAVDIKLFLRSEILKVRNDVKELFDLLISQSEKFSGVLLPGYTHLQVAMPSSAGLWLGAYAESLADDMEQLATAYKLANKNPLGSGAGYGSSFPLNRSRTTELLEFSAMHYNSVYAQMSRGKTEKVVAYALSSVAATLSKLAMDCCLYLSQNFNFISFPDELTTGSSIMPHKKNPDVFELVRAHCNRIQAVPTELTLLLNNLPSGYHRDLQLTKEIIFPVFKQLRDCVTMTSLMIRNISFRNDILKEEKYRYIFSVEAVNELVNQGMPFREAYKRVGDEISQGRFNYDFEKGLNHTHEGSIGNLCNDRIVEAMTKAMRGFDEVE